MKDIFKTSDIDNVFLESRSGGTLKNEQETRVTGVSRSSGICSLLNSFSKYEVACTPEINMECYRSKSGWNMASGAPTVVQVTECKQTYKLNKCSHRGKYKTPWCYKDSILPGEEDREGSLPWVQGRVPWKPETLGTQLHSFKFGSKMTDPVCLKHHKFLIKIKCFVDLQIKYLSWPCLLYSEMGVQQPLLQSVVCTSKLRMVNLFSKV